jgi:hypothetical protein
MPNNPSFNHPPIREPVMELEVELPNANRNLPALKLPVRFKNFTRAWSEYFTNMSRGVARMWPVGSVFISVVATNPADLIGFGTWQAIGAGRVLVGVDASDSDFNTVEETGGAKTVAAAGTVAAPTISGSTANESAHTHSVTSNVTVGDHPAHTHDFTQDANEATPNLVAEDTTAAGVAASGTTGDPSATLSHTVTNNAVTSGAGSAHSHGAGTLAASAPAFTGTATSVVQPYLTVYMWKRTA